MLEEPLNEFYPNDGWCKVWSANDGKRLQIVFVQELKPIFEKLTNDELLKSLTQNQNESVNGVLYTLETMPENKVLQET